MMPLLWSTVLWSGLLIPGKVVTVCFAVFCEKKLSLFAANLSSSPFQIQNTSEWSWLCKSVSWILSFFFSMKSVYHIRTSQNHRHLPNAGRVFFYPVGVAGTNRVNNRGWRLRSIETLVQELNDTEVDEWIFAFNHPFVVHTCLVLSFGKSKFVIFCTTSMHAVCRCETTQLCYCRKAMFHWSTFLVFQSRSRWSALMHPAPLVFKDYGQASRFHKENVPVPQKS